MDKRPPIDIPGEGIDPKRGEDLLGGKINPLAFKRNSTLMKSSVEALALLIKMGDLVALSKGITLIESTKDADKERARDLIKMCLKDSISSVRVGISGSPGVGKSTFIESLGLQLVNQNKKVAVLAIDPSSSITGGSILGDKTRMMNLSIHPNAFIRPSPARKALGGVARHTREAIILCEAAGFDTILIETVGVGQSETLVQSMVDLFLLLILPGAGDDLQGIKRGVVEMADLVVINKADGDRVNAAKLSKAFYLQALHLFPAKENGHAVKVLACSSTQSEGIVEVWEEINSIIQINKKLGLFAKNREQQLLHWFRDTIQNNLYDSFFNFPGIKEEMIDLQKQILNHLTSPFMAADLLLKRFFDQLHNHK